MKNPLSRTLRMASLVFFLSFLFWEFFTPFNQFGEPLPLIGLELIFWGIIAIAESLPLILSISQTIKILLAMN